MDAETVEKFVGLAKKMDQAWKGKLAQEVSEKVAEMEDIDYFTKQFVIEYAQIVSMNDKQFDEMQRHQRELRELLVAGLKRKPELAVKQRVS